MRNACLAAFGFVAAVSGLTTVAARPQSVAPGRIEAAFQKFWAAQNPDEAGNAAKKIVETGIGFDEALRRLRQGRTYVPDVPRGIVRLMNRTSDGLEHHYVLNVPDTYDPARKYQVRFQLHGGVVRREGNKPIGPDTIGALEGVEQIYVIPYAWREAPWWSDTQIESLGAIVDRLRRTYNVDENRVVLSGVSDGGTGVYYVAMRDTTEYASFLPLNGFVLVLGNPDVGAEGDLFPNNLLNKPFFIVNGALDKLYPAETVAPYVEHLKKGGVDLVWAPQAIGEHNVRWWPRVKDTFETFVRDHPRDPLPDTLTWQASHADRHNRAHWLVIDKLTGDRSDTADDLNVFTPPPRPDFGLRTITTRVTGVTPGSNAARIGLKLRDVVVRINDQTVPGGTEVDEVLTDYPVGKVIQFLVARDNLPVELNGTFDPEPLPQPPGLLFDSAAVSGRVDLVRTGNTVRATTRGVAAFTLLLSPDDFDFSQPVAVVANGHQIFSGRVDENLATLLKWAARDNDRTMLFAAALHIDVAASSAEAER